MSELTPVSPLLDGFTIGTPVNDHFGIRCYPAVKADSDRKYIVKVISIPASQAQLDALLFTGAYKDPAEAAQYFRAIATDVVQQVAFLRKMARLEGFLPFEGHQVEAMEKNVVGYNVHLLSGFRLSLERYIHRQTVTHLEAVNLGIDLCAALSACRKEGMLYVALKPANIFISTKKEYKIGDLGFVAMDALKYTPMPAKYRSCYTPPELMDDLSVLNETADTYAVGMILYQLFNNGILPPDVNDLHAPVNADDEISKIILKACAADPKDRWADPTEMGQALIDYMQAGTINDTPLMSPLAAAAVKSGAGFETGKFPLPAEQKEEAPAEAPAAESMEPAEPEQQPETPAPANEEPIIEIPIVGNNTDADVVIPDEKFEAIQKSGKKRRKKKSKKHDAEEPVAEEAAQTAETVPEAPSEEPAPEAPAEEPVNEEAPEAVNAEEAPVETEEKTVEAEAPVEEAAEAQQEDAAVAESIENAAAEEFAVMSGGSAEPPIDGEHLDSELKELHQILRSDKQPPRPAVKHPNIQPVVIKPVKKKKSPIRVLSTILLFCLLIAAGFWGYLFYQTEYLKVINDLSVAGSMDELVVAIDSEIPDNLLSVSCTDTYGHAQRQNVRGGKAVFQDLAPDTLYKIQVEIAGVHKLSGPSSDIFTTETVTNVVSFTATVGQADGSATLNLVVDGHEPDQWQVIYTAEGEPELGHTFNGHTTEINNLVLGKTYTFRLETGRHESVNGQTTVEMKAVKLVYAKDLTVVSCQNGEMKVTWAATGEAEDGWRVYCSGEDYDQVMECTDLEATFTGIDSAKAYTIEVKANGMNQANRIDVSANPITISNFKVDESDPQEIKLSWDYEGSAPAGGWVVTYTLDGGNLPSAEKTSESSITIAPKIPGTEYHFTIEAADNTSVFNGIQSYRCSGAAGFTGHGLTVNSLTAKLLVTPDVEYWSHETISTNAYTDTFTVGQPISMVLSSSIGFYLDQDTIHALYVYRDQNGNALAEVIGEQDLSWYDMWIHDDYHYAELNIPASPIRPGAYTLELYFNGMLVTTSSLNVN